ncbi:MAG: DNA primase family protein [Elusimicrobiota bacterium]
MEITDHRKKECLEDLLLLPLKRLKESKISFNLFQGSAGRGMARPGMVRQGLAWHGEARRGEEFGGTINRLYIQGLAWRGMAGLGLARRGGARRGKESLPVLFKKQAIKKMEKEKSKYVEEKIEKEKDKNFSKESIKNLSQKIGGYFYKKDLAKKIIELQPCFYDKAKNWWLWNWQKTKWERVDETDILNAVETQATINTINSKEKNEMLEAIKQVSRLDPPVKIKPTWIQFKNMIYDIETGEEFRAIPQWFVTNPIPWELHPERFMETPTMDKIFEEWVGKDYVQTLYEILAYCMLPDYPIHRIFCFIGRGLNGKGCFLRLMRRFIGGDNVASTELDTLLTSRFEITRLHKKLVCQMGETNFSEMNKTSMLKKLTGEDLIGFEYKNKDPFEDENYAKIIIATNNLPATSDKTIGFYRRWMLIDFPNQFSEKKDILKEIPDEEYKALALKCTFILKDILEKRKFTKEGSIAERMKRYEDKSNPLKKFFEENVIENINGFITKADFRRKLKEWCKENRFREISDRSIKHFMDDRGIESNQRTLDFLDDRGNKIIGRVWEGVKWA